AATAPGRRRWEKTVENQADGAQVSVTVDALEPLAAPADAGGPPAPPPPVEPAAPSPWTPRRTAGMVVGAVGIVGGGIGSYFGIPALDKKSQSNEGHCRADNHCDPTGITLRDQGMTAATASTVLFLVGGAALVTGVTLALLPTSAPRGGAASLVVGPGNLR